MKSQLWGSALLGLALLSGSAQASIITINFDELTTGTAVSNQYAGQGVLFSTNTSSLLTVGDPFQGSQPNLLCAITASPGSGCDNWIIITFTTPMSNVAFDAFANQTALGQAFATADIFQNGSGTASQTVNLNVTHTQSNTADHITLSFSNITGITIKPTASELGANNGTEYDNFSITTQALAPVPEPSTLLLTGLVGLVWGGRRLVARKRA